MESKGHDETASKMRVTWVIAQLTSGGIGPVCRNAAEGLARYAKWPATVVALHDPVRDVTEAGVRHVGLGLDRDVANRFLQWLANNPTDILITNDVSYLEPSFPYFPPSTLHIVQIHDSAQRYLDVAIRNQLYIDAVVCVARHLTERLRKPLAIAGFQGPLETIYNGAVFPPPPHRQFYEGPLRLLYLGRMDAFKGISDSVPIMSRLVKMAIPVRLTMAGGKSDFVEHEFRRRQLERFVDWPGFVPHDECFSLAAKHDVFLMPSRKEAFGMATIEAMSMGCVPLAYDIVSGSREIIEHDKSGLLLPLGRLKNWTTAIQSLSNNRERLLQLSKGAMRRAREDFDEITMARNLSDFCRRLKQSAQMHRSIRKTGLSTAASDSTVHVSNYRKLPSRWRRELRNRVGAYPRLSYWLLKHWA